MKKNLFASVVVFGLLASAAHADLNTNVKQTVMQVDTTNNRVSIGIDPAVASPTVTFEVSGTSKVNGASVSQTSIAMAAQTVTPTLTPLGRLAINTSGTLCIVSPSGAFVKVASPATACGFGAGSN